MTAAAVASLSFFGLSAQPAVAASTQTICSSKYSSESVGILFPSGKDEYLQNSKCDNYVPGGSKVFPGKSYRVGYDYGPYSECRTNSGFVPYKAARIIYFRAYSGNSC